MMIKSVQAIDIIEYNGDTYLCIKQYPERECEVKISKKQLKEIKNRLTVE